MFARTRVPGDLPPRRLRVGISTGVEFKKTRFTFFFDMWPKTEARYPLATTRFLRVPGGCAYSFLPSRRDDRLGEKRGGSEHSRAEQADTRLELVVRGTAFLRVGAARLAHSKPRPASVIFGRM